MKFKNGQKVSYEINGKRYSGVIKETNSECVPYEIEFAERPTIGGLNVDSLLVNKVNLKNLKKIIGTIKNE